MNLITISHIWRPLSCIPLFTLMLALGCSKPAVPTAVTGSADGTNKTSKNTQVSRGTIGYTTMTLRNPFFKIIGDTLIAEGQEHGFQVIVTDPNDDVSLQSQHVDDFIAQKVTAIVISPTDKNGIAAAIARANAAQIPVFTCDTQCDDPGVKIAGHTGTDNVQGGELAGQAMIEAIGNLGGEVLILHFAQTNSCSERVAGFRKAIESHNATAPAKITIVGELEGGGAQDLSFKATSDALQAHPNLAGIFAINDPSALGAWTALKQASKTDQVVMIGFDGQLEGKQAILDGNIYADPIQFPEQMGAKTVEKIVKYLNGEEFEPVELIPTALYRKSDAENDPDLKASH